MILIKMPKARIEKQRGELTIDGRARQGGLSDAGLEFDLHAVLLLEELIPLLAVLGDPLLEGLADEGVDDVADVAPGHLADLPDDGKGVDDGAAGEAEVQDEVEGEVLVVGDGDDLDVLAGDGLEGRKSIRRRRLFCSSLTFFSPEARSFMCQMVTVG